ncbi:hypothetical protein QQ045_000636 [Rhodiola kirilowii]
METHTTLMPETQPSESEPPHDALYLVLAYLPLFDLLSFSQVCTSFRQAIQYDVLLWLHIYVDKPLSSKISDHTLLRIASRANGRITSLALLNCPRITDQGLQHVIYTNPLIEKLYIPGCTGLTPDGVLSAVKSLTTSNHKLQALKISNIHNVTKTHLDSLRNFLPPNISSQHSHPAYFHNRNIISLHQNQNPIPPIDLDICPKCREVRTVFDCPRESCQQKNQQLQCRGCRYCVVRCEECGGCVDNDDDEVGEEAACGDTLCLKCWLMFPKCDFCNKAYCKQHAAQGQGCTSAGSSGFVCSVCLLDENYLEAE